MVRETCHFYRIVGRKFVSNKNMVVVWTSEATVFSFLFWWTTF
jgi:hypothetical protein